MKHPFNRFAVRYLAAVLLGLLALMLHGSVQGGILAVLVPQAPSPWELSKLAFWPLLVVFLLSRLLKREHALGRQLPALVLAPVALTLLCWALMSLGGSGPWCLVVWMCVLAVTLAWGTPEKLGRWPLWPVLALALVGFYILLTYLPLYWGPFLDPRDVAAMATIPC